MRYQATEAFAKRLDSEDPLREFRSEFLVPRITDGPRREKESIYLVGNSLGLQPRRTRALIDEELEDWARLGVEGHARARHPWTPYHENLTESLARIVGAKATEVVAMNTLTVNLHLMMVSFYRPTRARYKILIEGGAFPSDQYAVASQARFHARTLGFDPKEAVLEIKPRAGESTLRHDDILEMIRHHGSELALVMLGNVNYLTGQRFDMEGIAHEAHAQGAFVGFDLAHGAGNLLLQLHDWNVDFAVWCSYKYLNGGPGTLAGCFVHELHHVDPSIPRFEGWWGTSKQARFEMRPVFEPIPSAEAWMLSNSPIFQLAALRASLEMFDRATMPAIRKKGDLLTGYLEFLIHGIAGTPYRILTPAAPGERGCQLSIQARDARGLQRKLAAAGAICDFREPDVVRAAPAPLYNSFEDIFHFVQILREFAPEHGVST